MDFLQRVVLVALDGSEEARRAIPLARTVATQIRARLEALHVTAREEENNSVRAALGLDGAGLRDIPLRVRTGAKVADAIIEEIDRPEVELLVMTTVAAGNKARDLGTVARQVAIQASRPVIGVRPELAPAEGAAAPVKRLVLPVDGSRGTAAALRVVKHLTSQLEASVDVLLVVTPGAAPAEQETGSIAGLKYVDQPQHEWKTWADEFKQRLIVQSAGYAPAADIGIHLREGDPAEEIVKFAELGRYDAIALVRRSKLQPGHGRTLQAVIRYSPCPFILAGGSPLARLTADGHVSLLPQQIDAAIFDMDGVVTRTASVHAAAWKQMFDRYLKQRVPDGQRAFAPFDIDTDYRLYVDGKPRNDGVVAFLTSRAISLPYGDSNDPPEWETICGLANRKDAYFIEILRTQGAHVFESTIKLIRQLRLHRIKTGIFSASRHANEVLRAANVLDLFDAKVDGVDADRLKLPGKPDPATLVELTKRLWVSPDRTIVFEDSLAGVKAAQTGNFGLIIGVNRGNAPDLLVDEGATFEVKDLADVNLRK